MYANEWATLHDIVVASKKNASLTTDRRWNMYDETNIEMCYPPAPSAKDQILAYKQGK